MKKLLIFLLIAVFFAACNSTNPEPEPEPQADPPNSIAYKSISNQVVSLHHNTTIKFKVIYHINQNEISTNGFQVSETVATDINAPSKRVSHKFELTSRTDTLQYSTNLRDYASPGDTAYFIVNLSRRKTENTYYTLASDTAIFKVIY